MNIYVGNLSYTLSEDDLRKLFSEFGETGQVTIIKDKMSGKSKGFGFVEMPNKAEADAAISSLNNSEVGGRKLVVNEARPKTEGGGMGGGMGGGRREGGGGGGGAGRGGFGGGGFRDRR